MCAMRGLKPQFTYIMSVIDFKYREACCECLVVYFLPQRLLGWVCYTAWIRVPSKKDLFVRVDPSCDGQLLIIRKIDPWAICFFWPVLEREIERLAQTWLTKIFSRYFYCNILICSYIIAYDSNNVILSRSFFSVWLVS